MEKVISLFGMKLPVKAAPSNDRETGGSNDSVQYLYDDSKRLTKVLYPEGTSQSFAYDRSGNLRERKTAQGQSFSYGYDAHERLRSITDDQGEKVTYDYGPRRTRSANSTCVTETDFDENKRPVCVRQIIDGVVFRTDYAYDAAGRCIGIRPRARFNGCVMTATIRIKRCTSALKITKAISR
jgi:YD repeat-containing protein